MATHGSKLKVLTKDLTLEQTLDVDGNRVVVTIRRVPLSRLAGIFRAAPGFVAAMAPREEPKPDSSAGAMERMGDTEAFYTAAEQVVMAACVKPRFYKTNPELPVLYADDADVADVDSLAEPDKADIMKAALELSGYFVSEGEAKATATFPDGDRGGRESGGPDGAPVPSGSAPA